MTTSAHIRTTPPVDLLCDPGRTAVLLIDLQLQFVRPDSPFHVGGADELVTRASSFAGRARDHGASIVWVAQRRPPGAPPARTTSRFAGTELHIGPSADLDPRLDVRVGVDHMVIKPRQSSFHGTGLEEWLRARRIDVLLLAGMTTNVCILATAKDAAELDLAVHVLGDLTASLPVRGAGGDEILSAEETQRASLAICHWAYGDVTGSAHVSWSSGSRPEGGRPPETDTEREAR